MKTHTTNYHNTFVAIAEDSPATAGEIPPRKGDVKSVANLQFDLISQHPYQFTSDDVMFQVYAERNDVAESERQQAREQFFAKGQPCFRASPLTKRYGWGLHCDPDGKIALYGCDTPEYQALQQDPKLKVVKAMKSSR